MPNSSTELPGNPITPHALPSHSTPHTSPPHSFSSHPSSPFLFISLCSFFFHLPFSIPFPPYSLPPPTGRFYSHLPTLPPHSTSPFSYSFRFLLNLPTFFSSPHLFLSITCFLFLPISPNVFPTSPHSSSLSN